jgi:hypothetical protein
MRGTGEGHRPFDLQPPSTTTNGTVGSVTGTTGADPDGYYQGGEKTIVVPPHTHRLSPLSRARGRCLWPERTSMISALPVPHHVVDGAFPAHDALIERCAQDPLSQLLPPDAFHWGHLQPLLFWSRLPTVRANWRVSQPQAFEASVP